MKYMLLIKLLLFPLFMQAQIHGKVYDAVNHLPLEGALIAHRDKKIATTASDGSFTISNTYFQDTLQVRYIGYNTQQVVVKDSTLAILLKSSPEQLSHVVVKAYNSREKIFKAPASIDVLTGSQLGEVAHFRPSNAFNSMAGVMMHSGARNTSRLAVRGIGSRSMYTTTKIKAYINQIPLTTGAGETDVADIDLELTDRITVLKGPASSIYGAALGGTILYRMSEKKDQTAITQEFRAGSFGTFKNRTEASWGNNRHYADVAYTKLKSRGFRANDDYNRDAVTLLAGSELTENMRLNYLGRWLRMLAHIPSSLNVVDYKGNPNTAADNWQAVNGHEDNTKWLHGLSLHSRISPELANTTSIFLKHYSGDEVRPFNILDDRNFAIGMRTMFHWQKSLRKSRIEADAGYEGFRENYRWKVFQTLEAGRKGPRINKNAQLRFRHDIFASLKWKWRRITSNAGLNINKTGYRYRDLGADTADMSDAKHYNWLISPRISLTYQVSGDMVLYGSLSHGFSAPSYEETLNASGFVNDSLRPETGWNREIGVRLRLWNERVFAKMALYSVQVKNLLVTRRPAEDEFYKVNAGSTLHRGLEITGRVHFLKSRPLQGFVGISYTLADYRFDSFVHKGNDYSGNRLPGIPNGKVNATAELHSDNGLFVQAGWLNTGAMFLNDANTKTYKGFNRLNVKVGYRTAIQSQWRLKGYAGVRNLTNNPYASMILINAPSYEGSLPRYYYPAAPINFYAGISINWYR